MPGCKVRAVGWEGVPAELLHSRDGLLCRGQWGRARHLGTRDPLPQTSTHRRGLQVQIIHFKFIFIIINVKWEFLQIKCFSSWMLSREWYPLLQYHLNLFLYWFRFRILNRMTLVSGEFGAGSEECWDCSEWDSLFFAWFRYFSLHISFVSHTNLCFAFSNRKQGQWRTGAELRCFVLNSDWKHVIISFTYTLF